MTITYSVELTDTFAGEANYSWVRRATIEMPEIHSQLQLVRAAKKAVSINGLRFDVCDTGSMLEMRAPDRCLVCFVTFDGD